MELTADQLEWIVCEVVRRLRAMGVGGAQEANSEASAGGELSLTDRVITARQLDDRLTGVKQVRISQAAVITPSARDLLKDRGIELLRNA